MASFNVVKSVEKTLAVLAEMNRHPISKIKALASALSLPHSTVVRVLETLEALGYVRRIDRRTGYCLTEKVTLLSAGYHGFPAILDDAVGIAEQLTEAHLWPVALATLDDDVMMVRYSTIPRSPLSHAHSTLNKRLDLLNRAHGRAYLAFCPEIERDRLFQKLSNDGNLGKPHHRLKRDMAPVLENIRQQGVAIRAHDLDPDTTTLAAPILRNNCVVATIGMTVFKGARQDIQMLMGEIKSAARKISDIL